MMNGNFRGRRIISPVLSMTAALLFFSFQGLGFAEASSGKGEKNSANEKEWQEPVPEGISRPGFIDPGIASLRIDESWRHYKKIPSRFQDLTREPERFFNLESQPLRQLVRSTLKENPGLKEAEAAWKASLKKVRVVSALPDPNLAVTAFLESVETRVGPQEAVLSFTQKLPWFGKLSTAGQAALEEALEKAWTWRSIQRETVLKVKKTFYDLMYLAEALRITEEDLSTLRRYESIALTRYGTGKGIQQNVIKVQSEITRLNERKIVLLRQQGIARQSMARLVEKPLVEVVIDTSDQQLYILDIQDIRLQDLYGKVQKNREELQARLHAVRARQQEVRLARKQYWPDLKLGFNYIVVGDREDRAGILNPPQDNGQDAVGILAGINVPIWYHKLGAGVDEAVQKEYRAKAAYAREEDNMLFELQDAYITLESLGDQLGLYQHALIPQARQSLESSEAAYETGKISFLELLDSERFLLNVRYGHAKIKSDYLTAQARMERALGARFPDIEREKEFKRGDFH